MGKLVAIPLPSSEFPHLDEDAFRDAIQFTAGKTAFPPVLIEKDYFCSLVLREIYRSEIRTLVFKGGTSLNKVHAGFYRLSEDLDFSISISTSSKKAERRTAISPVKELVRELSRLIPGVHSMGNLKGSNESRQYNVDMEYRSCLSTNLGFIRVEIGLREEIILKAAYSDAHTMVLDPFRDRPLIEPFQVTTLNIVEAYAEKMRAALSRREPAIRDLFDIDFAMREQKVDFFEPSFHQLLLQKLKTSGNGEIKLDDGRMVQMLAQVETELRPVLRPDDFERFEFEGSWKELIKIGQLLGKKA